MVPRKRFVEIADECGLECVEWSNFHEYVRGKLRDDGSTATATATDASTEGKKTRPGEIAGGAATAHEHVAADDGRKERARGDAERGRVGGGVSLRDVRV